MKDLSQGQRTGRGSRKERVLAWWEGPEGGREMGGRGGLGRGEDGPEEGQESGLEREAQAPVKQEVK